eukprot:CAMPEP_0172453442 /NCGR_PEP_ID=MMETSP1065-20121228/10761_1 /TAXON_ID=265537 /ORGANISM="Amphiprora paludosa, Strain CCMP125" /LENGTH=392 /DNA_ID=CAMNT_0013205623 /DNA_START=119 /DNA_END=1297 /DNA_ORIENTATION=+
MSLEADRSGNGVVDIEDLHQKSLLQGSTTYIDPSTGFTVFTELLHLKRGRCCGNRCRHCPFGWENVANGDRREAHVQSGDKVAIQAILSELEEKQKVARQQEKLRKSKSDSTKDDTGSSRKKETGGRFGGVLTSKNVPYTRGGDHGTSQLLTGERRSKTDDSFEAMGTVDELCTVVGVVYAHLKQELDQHKQSGQKFNEKLQTNADDLDEWLLEIMSRLFDIGSHLAKPKPINDDTSSSDEDDDERSTSEKVAQRKSRVFVADGIGGGFHAQHVKELEEAIDIMTEDLPELRSFLLPASPSIAVAQCHVARTVCRRAERSVIPLVNSGVCDPNALAYVNRLSDFWFTAARWIHRHVAKQPNDIEYKRPHRGARQRQRTRVEAKDEENEQDHM